MNWMELARGLGRAGWIVIAALMVAALALWSSMAQAQGGGCWPRAVAVHLLRDTLRETRQSIGLTQEGAVIEIWASEEGAWTATHTRADGVTCIVSQGEAFEAVYRPPPDG